jgi:hypothetical protein
MDKNRKTSHILNIFQYDEVTGAVTLPSTLTIAAPSGSDNSTKVVTSAWARTYVTGLNYLTAGSTTTSDIGEGTNLYYTTSRFDTRFGTKSTTDLAEGTNLYYTQARFDTAFGNKSTTNLSEGDNLYYTQTRFNSAFSAKSTSDLTEGTNLYYTATRFNTAFSGKSTTDLSEGTNQYFTNARARAAISVTGSGSYDSATGVITVTGGVTAVNTKTGDVTLTTADIAEGINKYYTDSRVGTYLTSNGYATQSYVTTQIANLVDSSPATLDTLNELAAALGDDPNFATTVATSIGTKQNQLNGTGFVKISGTTISYDNNTYLTSFTETDPIYVASTWYSTTNNATNWNTAYGWGNHAIVGYLTSIPTHNQAWSTITSTPTTISGYGITNAYTDAQIQNFFNGANAITGYNKSNWDTAYGWGNHASGGYLTGITSSQVTTALGYTPYNSTNPSGYITGITSSNVTTALGYTPYNSTNPNGYITGITSSNVTTALGYTPYNSTNPSGYITTSSLTWSNISGKPTALSSFTNDLGNYGGWITGYTETDTLASVTGRGATTTAAITVTASEGREVAVYMPSSYTTNDLVSGHEYGWYDDHWRLGMTRSGSAPGADFVVQWNAARRLSLTNGGNLTVTGTISASNLSGTNTGDQTNISGNAATATNVAWTGVTGRPTAVSQFTNDSGYITGVTNISGYSGSVSIPDWRNTSYTPAQYDGNRVNWHFNNTGYNNSPPGDFWGVMQTVSPWSEFNTSHRQSQLWWGGSVGLSYRYAVGSGYTPTGWSAWETIITSATIGAQSVSYATTSGNAASVNSKTVGNGKGNIGYFDSVGNLYITNPETYTGEVRLGAAWARGGVYASSTLSMSTSSGNINFVSNDTTIGGFRWDSANGTRFIVGLDANVQTPYTLVDANKRPIMYARGAYPALVLDHTETSNTNHGPTIQFVFNGLDARQWLIGAAGNGSKLDFGMSNAAYGNTSYNPHNGIAGYTGKTVMRMTETGVLFGDCGTYPTINTASHPLQVNGTAYISSTLSMGGYIRMGVFPNSTTNTGEAWIGRASDRNAGTMTVQLGGNSASNRSFEVVDYGWSVVMFSVNSSNGNVTASGDITAYSDIRVKENIVRIDSALNKIKSINGYYFNRTDVADKTKKIGFIAQEVLEVVPEIVNYNIEQDRYSISYGNTAALLVEAIKEQQLQIEELKKQINYLVENK